MKIAFIIVTALVSIYHAPVGWVNVGAAFLCGIVVCAAVIDLAISKIT